MPLERQIVDVPIATSVNTKFDSRALQQGQATIVQNARINQRGKLSKRYGHAALTKSVSGGGTLAASVAGASRGGIPVLIDGTNLYTYSEVALAWNQADQVPEVAVHDRVPITGYSGNVGQGSGTIYDADLAYCNGYLLSVWTTDVEGTGFLDIWYQVTDAVTNAVVVAGSNLTLGTSDGNHLAPKLSVCGTTVVLTYVITSVGDLMARSIDMTVPTSGWSGADFVATLTGDGPNGVYDAVPIEGDPTRFAVAAEHASGTSMALYICPSTAPFTPTSTTLFDTKSVYAEMVNIGLRSTNGEFHWIAYTAVTGSGVPGSAAVTRLAAIADAGLAVQSPATMHTWPAIGTVAGKIAVERFSASVVGVFFSPVPTAGHVFDGAYVSFQQATLSGGAVVTSGPTRTTAGVYLDSRPLYLGTGGAFGQCYAWVYNGSSLQGSYYLVCFDYFGNTSSLDVLARLVANPAPRLAQNIPLPGVEYSSYNMTTRNFVEVPTPSATVYCYPVFISTNPGYSTLQLQVIDFADPDRYVSSDLPANNVLGLACGSPSSFDGQQVTELGYAYYPELPASVPATSGGSMADGTYSYEVTWEWYDAAGNWHVSAPSPPISAVVSGGGGLGSVALTVPCLHLTNRRQSTLVLSGRGPGPAPVAVIYRTTASGAVYYRVGQIRMNVSTTSVTFTDTLADAAITSNALLYTTGGVYPNFQPPSSRVMVLHDGRWWLAGADDPKFIWPSQSVTDGVMPGFNEALNFLCTGAVRALASMDQNLIVFVQRGAQYGIEYINGDGPTNVGSNSNWSGPYPIPSPTGALDQRSVCTTPAGVVFFSPNGGTSGQGGIYLLTRDLQVQYIGEPVEGLLSAGMACTSAVLHPTTPRVYLTFVNSDASPTNGLRIVWDFQEQTWCMDALGDPDAASFGNQAPPRWEWVANGPTATSGFGPVVMWCTPAGRVYSEYQAAAASTCLDGGQWYQMQWQSPWLKSTAQGYNRFWKVRLKGNADDPADLRVILGFDEGSYTEPSTWTAATVATFDRWPEVQVLITPGNSKAMSMQITILDLQPSGPSVSSGAGFSWLSASLEIAIDPRGYPNLPAGQRA